MNDNKVSYLLLLPLMFTAFSFLRRLVNFQKNLLKLLIFFQNLQEGQKTNLIFLGLQIFLEHFLLFIPKNYFSFSSFHSIPKMSLFYLTDFLPR
jgi:hypothetical protein